MARGAWEATIEDMRAARTSHTVRLPSGTAIEVVELALPDLLVCGRCASPLVQPVEWREAGPDRWTVRLRCPECEWTDAGLYDDATVTRMDDEIDRATDALTGALAELVRATMEDEVERFCRALRDGHVLPEDF
jgi:hypothetical protein